MKIAHLVSTFPPYQGGMGNVCLAQIKELVNLGHTISVFTPGYSSEKIPNPKFQIPSPEGKPSTFYRAGEFQIQNSKFQINYLRSLFSCGNASFVPGIIKELKNFDLIHLHWPFLGGAEILLLWHLFRKKPKLIVQYHMDLVAPGIKGLIFKLNFFLFAPLMIKLADKILISSRDYLEHSDLKKYWLKNKNKFIISSFGVNQEKFYPQEKNQQLIKKYGLKQNDQIILSVGGLDKAHYFKGIRLLIQAVVDLKNQMPNLKLILVGDGDLRPSYEKLVKDFEIQNKIIFVGRVEDDDLPDYYNLVDVFVFPSFTRSEAFGLVCLEAMACAKPIIVSNLPGVRTLVDNNGLVVKINDVQDLSEKICNIFQNKDKLKEFGINGLRKIKEGYYWPDIVRQLEEIYAQAINSDN